MWQHLDLSLGEEDISNAGKINFLGRKTRFPREERKSSYVGTKEFLRDFLVLGYLAEKK